MPIYSPRELNPTVHVMTSWYAKAQFELAKDRSPIWMLFVVKEGSFRFGIGEREGIAEKGDLVLCPPDTELRREMLRPATFLVLYYSWFDALGAIVAEEEIVVDRIGKNTIRDTRRFESTYDYLEPLKRRSDPPAAARSSFLLRDLWEQIEWEWAEGRQTEQPLLPDDPLMQQAALALEESAYDMVSMNQLASSLGLSTVQFSRRFRKRFGVNPSEYVSGLRLDKARALLQDNRLTLEEIALQCGYSNGFYFSRVFSQKMRISPSEYRRAYRM
ncbi:helix-turn-helix domain-containing protein [Paenibacillus hodogayensis]|uniref:Helix-turn-helix domain-containing protein n=1 Tax=Paenibacillus hodogayensis TaxID=279208 RepID=A0ABV5W154_9BACL